MSRLHATVAGFGAVLLWAALALLTEFTRPVPPFQMTAMTFAIGAGAGALVLRLSGRRLPPPAAIPLGAWALGVGGLFGYHALYFAALRLAPPAEASLIAYLWPLLIVLFSGLLPGERLRAGHVLGAVLAAGGAALVLWQGGAFGGAGPGRLWGYVLAALGAVTWAGYSVLSRRVAQVPSAAVVWFCLAVAVLALPVHLLVERSLWPATAAGVAALVGLGLGPVGLAFFLWDIGMKRGDIQWLGVAAYAAPLLSTLLLVVAGVTPPGPRLALAALLIAAGAVVAGRRGRRGGGA